MKKLILIAFLLTFGVSIGQIIPKVDGWVTRGKATPTSPVDGEIYYNSTSKKTFQWNGTTWIDLSSVGTVTSVAGKTGVVTLVKGDVGLANVDNTSDLAKPISTATQTALDGKASLASANTWLAGNTFQGGITTSGASTINFSQSPVQLSGFTTTGGTKGTIITADGANSSITFNPSGTPRYLTATLTDITYNGTSLLSGGTWGSITGTLSNQTDLQTALNGKGGLDSPNIWTAGQTFNIVPQFQQYLALKEGGGTGSVAGHGSFSHQLNNSWRFIGSGQTFGNVFDFANTPAAQRTYTFPDKSGTVAMLDDVASGGTDSQTLSLSGTNNRTLNISGGNAVVLPGVVDNEVTSAKIVDGTIALVDMADNSVDSSRVIDGSLTGGDIANATIAFANIQNGSSGDFTNTSGVFTINAAAVNSAKIADGSIGIADLSATGTKDNTTVLHGDNVFRAVSGSTNNDALSEQALTANYTMLAGDFTTGRKVIYNNTANDYVVTVPDVATTGQKIIFSQYGSGKIQVGMGNGVTGTSFQTIDNKSNITLYKSAVGYRPVGAYDAYTPVVANPDLYAKGDAMDFNNETNTVAAGWSTSTPGTRVAVTDATETSTYSILFSNNNGDYDNWNISITGLEIGQNYTWTVRAKADNGSGGASTSDFITMSSGVSGVGKDIYDAFTTTYSTITNTWQATATTANMKVYADGNAGNTNSRLWIAYVTIVKQ